MSGRGSRKRGRPPKTPNERASGRFNYQLLKKPKYLSEGKSQPSTPSASRGISPQSDEGSRSSHNNHTNRSRGSAAKRGRGRKSAVQPNTSSYSGRKGGLKGHLNSNLGVKTYSFALTSSKINREHNVPYIDCSGENFDRFEWYSYFKRVFLCVKELPLHKRSNLIFS